MADPRPFSPTFEPSGVRCARRIYLRASGRPGPWSVASVMYEQVLAQRSRYERRKVAGVKALVGLVGGCRAGLPVRSLPVRSSDSCSAARRRRRPVWNWWSLWCHGGLAWKPPARRGHHRQAAPPLAAQARLPGARRPRDPGTGLDRPPGDRPRWRLGRGQRGVEPRDRDRPYGDRLFFGEKYGSKVAKPLVGVAESFAEVLSREWGIQGHDRAAARGARRHAAARRIGHGGGTSPAQAPAGGQAGS